MTLHDNLYSWTLSPVFRSNELHLTLVLTAKYTFLLTREHLRFETILQSNNCNMLQSNNCIMSNSRKLDIKIDVITNVDIMLA